MLNLVYTHMHAQIHIWVAPQNMKTNPCPWSKQIKCSLHPSPRRPETFFCNRDHYRKPPLIKTWRCGARFQWTHVQTQLLHIRLGDHLGRRGGETVRARGAGSLLWDCFLEMSEATPRKSHQCDWPDLRWTRTITTDMLKWMEISPMGPQPHTKSQATKGHWQWEK